MNQINTNVALTHDYIRIDASTKWLGKPVMTMMSKSRPSKIFSNSEKLSWVAPILKQPNNALGNLNNLLNANHMAICKLLYSGTDHLDK